MRKLFFGNREKRTSTKYFDSEEDSSIESKEYYNSWLKKQSDKKGRKYSESCSVFEGLITEQIQKDKCSTCTVSEDSDYSKYEGKTCRCHSCTRRKTNKSRAVFSTVKKLKSRDNYDSYSSEEDENESYLIVDEDNKDTEHTKAHNRVPETLKQEGQNFQRNSKLVSVSRPGGDGVVDYTEESSKLDDCQGNNLHLDRGDMGQNCSLRKTSPDAKLQAEVHFQGVEEASNSQEKTLNINKENTSPFKNTPKANLIVPKQVVFESKQLSIVAANPNQTKVNIKTGGQPAEMIGIPGTGGKHTDFLVEMMSRSAGANKLRPSVVQSNLLSDETDLFTDSEGEPVIGQGMNFVRENIVSLNPEITLTKMGITAEGVIDWSKVELPLKSDLHKLLYQRISNYLNPDILIKIGNHEYKCHMLVLQCYCDYFTDKPSRIEIDESNVTKSAFMYIYDWMLHLSPDSYQLLNRDNILEVFMGAQYLGVKELEDQCWNFIDNEDLFSEDRAFILYLDARKHGNRDIMDLMVPRIQNFFITLVSSKDFLDLTYEEVCVFLRSNFISIHGEIEVFMSAVRWLMFDWENRHKHLIEVMRCVRFGLIAPWQLVDIRRNPESQEFILVTKSPEVSQMIEDGLAFAIIKYWYGHDSTDYNSWIEMLGLTEPVGRNWSGTGKDYLFYRDFLTDLDTCRRSHKLERKRSKCSNKIGDTPVVNCNGISEAPELPPPPPVPGFNKKQLLNPMVCPQQNNAENNNKINDEMVYQIASRCLPHLEYNEMKLLKKMIQEQERLDMELKNNTDKEKYKENKCKQEEFKKKMKSMLGKNVDAIIDNINKQRINNKLKVDNSTVDKKQDFDKFNTLFNKREKSALVIQSAFRGYMTRKLFTNLFKNKNETKSRNVKPEKCCTNILNGSQEMNYITSDSLYFPKEEAVLVFGGRNLCENYGEETILERNIYRYLSVSNEWKCVGEMPEPVYHHGATLYKGKIIIAGGKNPIQVHQNRDSITRAVWCFDPVTRGWTHMPSLLHPRTHFGFVTCNGKLYAIGGRDHNDRILKSVEMYDSQTGHWTYVNNLNICRSGLAATQFRDQIWVAGGIIRDEFERYVCTSSVEAYDVSKNIWRPKESLRYPCCYSVLFSINERLYLIGGCIGDSQNCGTESTNTIDVWDPHSHKWCYKTEMKVPRHAHSVCSRDSQMLIIGGIASKLYRPIRTIECWDVKEEVWLNDIAKLPVSLSGQRSLTLPAASYKVEL